MTKLIVAEKPSVARGICAALGVNGKRDGYFESDKYVVSWCFGHLVSLADPPSYDERYRKWDIANLPILPTEFKTVLRGDASAKKQYGVLKELMHRKDVDEIICATDADREGELIFRLVYETAGCKKPVWRLWTSSLEEEAVLTAMKKLRPSREYDGLAAAAKGRQRADWLIGMNLTRLYTSMYRHKLTCGRVQTPTVAEIVRRQREIDNFVPVPYYNVVADFGDFHATCRMDDKRAAEVLAGQCVGKIGTVQKVDRKNKKDKAPCLYNLTDLQKDANKILGLSAKQTLDAAQLLYEKQLATYPRTDSKYLTSEMKDTASKVVSNILNAGYIDLPVDAKNAKYDINVLVNDAKVESHHAIIPTTQVTSGAFLGLSATEQGVLSLISYRVLIALGSPYAYISTNVEVELCNEVFSARGKQVLDLGWKALEERMKDALKKKKEKKSEEEEEEQKLPELAVGDTRKCVGCESVEKFTKPPSNYTDMTLLEFMASAGKKTVEDEAMRDAMTDDKGSWKGIGTSATRAGIIDNIIATGYVERKGKKLIPTELAFALVDAVDDSICDPSMTAEWEMQLSEIENNERSLDKFIGDIGAFCATTVKTSKVNPVIAERFNAASVKVVCKCPRCGGSVIEKKTRYECATNKYSKNEESGKWSRIAGCGFAIWGEVAGKRLSASVVKNLCEKGRSGVVKGFTSKAGKKFDAALKLVDDGESAKLEFVFDNSQNRKPVKKRF